MEDVLACPCGGRRRLVAAIDEPSAIVAILGAASVALAPGAGTADSLTLDSGQHASARAPRSPLTSARPRGAGARRCCLKAFEAAGQTEFLSVRFYLLHSLAYLLLTAVSLECGYAASAIRERSYCGRAEVNGPNMSAVMLTTGTTIGNDPELAFFRERP